MASEIGRATGTHGDLFSNSITFKRLFGLATQIDQLRSCRLHTERELHRLDHTFELLIVLSLCHVIAVHCPNQVQLLPSQVSRQVVAGDIGDRGCRHILAIGPNRRAFENGRKELARVHRRFGSVQADESGQVLVLRTESVVNPSAHAWPLSQSLTRMQLQKGLRVVPGIGVHSIQDAQPVGMLCSFRHQVGNPDAAFAVLPKLRHRTGMLLFSRLRLVVECVELRWATAHAEKNDSLCARDKRRRTILRIRMDLRGGRFCPLTAQRPQRQEAKSA